MPVEKKQRQNHKREELKMAIGNRVFLKRPMPSQELLDGFADLPAANIADTMGCISQLPAIHKSPLHTTGSVTIPQRVVSITPPSEYSPSEPEELASMTTEDMVGIAVIRDMVIRISSDTGMKPMTK